MKKHISEILVALLLALLVGSFFLHSDRLDVAIDYVGGAVLFFAFVAAGEQVSKWLGRGNCFAVISAACFFAFAAHLFL